MSPRASRSPFTDEAETVLTSLAEESAGWLSNDGLPVVASAASGMQEILKDGWNSGGVVVPCNNPDALAFEAIRLLENE